MPTVERIELKDVQGLVIRGYRDLPAASFLLLEVVDPQAAKRWIRRRADAITNGLVKPDDRALNLAFTAPGLRRLGLAPETVAMFSREFTGGMVTEHRSRILGDVGSSAPERWAWGGRRAEAIDALLLLYARDDAELARFRSSQESSLTRSGLRVVRRLETTPGSDREHFGFRDGISQPRIEGLGPAPARDSIKPGEFVLGYRNEYGLLTERPLVAPVADPDRLLPRDPEGSGDGDLGRNGTYLVFRQLSQDVHSFWEFCERATRGHGGANGRDPVWLAAKMVGRWPSGAPLVAAPHGDDPALAEDNDFGYHATDREGLRCPIGAHVRRANPRDSLDPNPGSERSVAVGKRHRLLRRGRKYGTSPPEAMPGRAEPREDDSEERGLHFISLCANIARQFEFIQHTWVNNPRFAGLYEDPDPLIVAGGAFTVQAKPVRLREAGPPEFVSVRGGAYLFLPGIRALRYLGRG